MVLAGWLLLFGELPGSVRFVPLNEAPVPTTVAVALPMESVRVRPGVAEPEALLKDQRLVMMAETGDIPARQKPRTRAIFFMSAWVGF